VNKILLEFPEALFFYKKYKYIKRSKIYIAGKPARIDTWMIRKGTGSLRDQNSNPLKNNNSDKRTMVMRGTKNYKVPNLTQSKDWTKKHPEKQNNSDERPEN
jgi:hypothetical protein